MYGLLMDQSRRTDGRLPAHPHGGAGAVLQSANRRRPLAGV